MNRRPCMAIAVLLAAAVWPAIALSADDDTRIRKAGERIAAAQAARKAAADHNVPADQRIARLLDLLAKEIADPSPNVAGIPSLGTATEIVQSNLIAALHEVGDVGALTTELRRATSPELGVALTIGIGDAITPSDNAALAAGTARSLSSLVAQAPGDLIRARAARALGNIALAQPTLEDDAVKVLAAALHDPGERLAQPDSGSPKPQRVNLVYADAAGMLRILGFDVQGTEVRGRKTPSERAERFRAAQEARTLDLTEDVDAGIRWVEAQDSLIDRGCVILWSSMNRKLEAAKGDVTIRLWIGSNVALVDKKPVALEAAPRLVGGKMRIPVSFLRQIP